MLVSDLFYQIDSRPKDLLVALFEGREKIDMAKLGTIGPGNPFMEILTGAITDSTFDNAWECLNNNSFIALFEENAGPVAQKEKSMKKAPTDISSEPEGINFIEPSDDTFNFDFCKNYSFLFTESLGKENCFNPLTAFHARSILLDILNRLYYKELPADINPGKLPLRQNEIHSLAQSLQGTKLPELPQDYFLPGNRFRFGEGKAKALNSTWYGFLQRLREHINRNDLDGVVQSLQDAFYAFSETGFPLNDFLKFDGMLFGCQWIARIDKSGNCKCYNDVFYPVTKGNKIPVGWVLFCQDAAQLRNHLCNCYKALGTPQSGAIGIEEFQKAFKDLIYGTAKPRTTFYQLCIGLQDAGRLFEKTLNRSTSTGEKAESSKLPEVSPQNRTGPENQPINERMLDGYAIPDWIGIKVMPAEDCIIRSPVVYRIQGLANMMRGLKPEDRSHDYSKSIKRIAGQFLSENKTHLIFCDPSKKSYWVEKNSVNLFEKQKNGRRRRPDLKR